MIEQLKNIFFNKNTQLIQSSNPFYNRDLSINVPTVVLIVFGILFVLFGVVLFLQYPKQKTKLQQFKNEQLEEFRKNNPKKKYIPYESTGLYVPSWERMKINSPLILGLVFLIIGLFFIIGKSFSLF